MNIFKPLIAQTKPMSHLASLEKLQSNRLKDNYVEHPEDRKYQAVEKAVLEEGLLYPIRVNKYPTFTAVNYHEWSVCDSACSLGAELKVPVYKFVKNALVRKFGKKWFKKLSLFAKEWRNKKIQ